MKKNILFLVCILPVIVYSQNSASFLSQKGYLGYSVFQPSFRKGMDRTGNWFGLEATFKDFIFSFHQGSLRHESADSTIGTPFGKTFGIGYRIGLDLEYGYNSFFSAGVKPFIEFRGISSQITNKVTNDATSSIGFALSPGLQLRFSHLYLIAKYDVGLHLNTVFWGGNGKYNAIKGYLGGLNFTIGFENSFDLLSPNLLSFRGLKKHIEKSERTKYSIENRGGSTYSVKTTITTTTTTYTPGEVLTSSINPFWGVGPSYSYIPVLKRQAPTSMKGVNLGIRYGYWMLDAFYEEGKIGLKGKVGRKEILVNFPKLRNYDFSSQISGKNYGGRLGFNLAKMIKFGSFVTSKGSRSIINKMVSFSRLNVFYTMGYTEFLDKPNYTFEGAQEKLDLYQSKKGIVADATNNPILIPTKSKFTGWGGSLEFGSVFFNYTWYKYKDASIADHTQFTVGSNIPVGRVFHSLRANYILNKLAKKRKMN